MQQRSHRFAEIVLGVDARRPAAGVVRFAFDCARLWGVRLRAVHAWHFPSCAAELPFGVPEEDRAAWEDHEVQLLSDALRTWREEYPDVAVLEDVRHLPPAEALVLRSADAGLVIVGRSGTGEPAGVALDVLREAPGPVVVVPVRPLGPPAHTLRRAGSSHISPHRPGTAAAPAQGRR